MRSSQAEKLLNSITDKYDVVSSTTSTSGVCNCVVKNNNFTDSEENAVLFYYRTFEDGSSLHTTLIANKQYGWGSEPSDGGVLGQRVGDLPIKSLVVSVPTQLMNKSIAESYLAANPKLLISKLSNVLEVQASMIDKQDHMLKEADWFITNIYNNTTKKTRNFFRATKKLLSSGLFPKLKITIEENE